MLYDEWQTAVDSSAWAIRLQERYSRRGVGGDGEGGRPIRWTSDAAPVL